MAFGNQLVRVHVALRERLEDLGEHLEEHLSGERRDLPDLRSHCLSFCAAVTEHHTAEDEGAFPVLAREHPELRPVLDELGRDHLIVSDALRELADLVARADDDGVSARDVRTELDSVSALLETHFTYEERRIAAALSALTGTLDAADAALVSRSVRVPRGA